MIDPDRALRAFTDVLAVEYREDEGMMRVVTMGEAYTVDVRDGLHQCPDREYHDVDYCKHVVAADLTRGRIDAPSGWLTVEDLDERAEPELVTDGGATWVVRDNDNDNEQTAESRSEAEQMADTAREFGSDDVEIIPPGGNGTPDPDPTPDQDEATERPPTEPCAVCGDPVAITEARSGPNGAPVHGTCFDGGEVVEVEEVEADATPADADAVADLPERSVAEDPLNWVPGDFIDHIDGTPAINRKGFEVLSHFYDISTHAEIQVAPEDTDHTYCRVKAKATTPEGRECEAFGSAHVDRDDDAELLLEMADTRARKRALSIATGVGAVAVAELKSEAER